MRALLRRPMTATVSFDETTSRACDRACRAEAVIERARTAVWLAR